ncbi:MAG TPA: DNA polymerase Y family protein [Gammaproteobacteria bacterium]|nr:DNA polymerase Y family protein [Gammaproteobacteria bacterium]
MPQSLPLPFLSPPPADPPSPPSATRPRPRPAATALWAAIYLPALPLESLGERADTAVPVAVIDGDTPQAPLVALSDGARDAGLHEGMIAGAASARISGLLLRVREPAREATLLDRLAAWGEGFTSLVSPEPPAALLLDIGGSLKLFGGAEALRERLQAELEDQGHAAQLALAPTPRAALWLARAGTAGSVTDSRRIAGRLGTLPLTALQLPERTVRDFERLGVRTVREAFRLPRDGLARRFDPALLRDWDRALGHLPEARRHWQAERKFTAERELPIALRETARLEPFIDDLLADLAIALRRHDAGIDRLTLSFEHPRLPSTPVTLRLLTISRDLAHMQRLTRIRLERLRLPDGVTTIRLHSGPFRPIVASTTALLEARSEQPAKQAALLETLRARLGRHAVCSLAPAADPRPEYAWQRVEPGMARHADRPARRPAWLLQTRQPLHEIKGIQLISGPERIEAGWWSEDAIGRDYYVARTASGARLWIYREHETRRWFLHGYFA